MPAHVKAPADKPLKLGETAAQLWATSQSSLTGSSINHDPEPRPRRTHHDAQGFVSGRRSSSKAGVHDAVPGVEKASFGRTVFLCLSGDQDWP
ncbi:hypothetical protein [Streptomyces sp. NPDC101150]|uniref:hypothetical protein n=1 Tax=Streptomyces sp. NPDC101150 TaxID=3366114 RepID=UPI00381006E4